MSEDLITHYIYLSIHFSKNPHNLVAYFYQVSKTRDKKKKEKDTVSFITALNNLMDQLGLSRWSDTW